MRVILGLALLGAAGCKNSCVAVCDEMEAYAAECEITMAETELKACYDSQKGSESRNNRATCSEFGDGEVIREEWTCADLAYFWGVEE